MLTIFTHSLQLFWVTETAADMKKHAVFSKIQVATLEVVNLRPSGLQWKLCSSMGQSREFIDCYLLSPSGQTDSSLKIL